MSSRAIGTSTTFPSRQSRQRVFNVLRSMADWKTQQGFGNSLPTEIVTVRKGNVRLLVHVFGERSCYLLTLGDTPPRLRTGRPWKWPLKKVLPKLALYGWTVVSRDKETGVGNAH